MRTLHVKKSVPLPTTLTPTSSPPIQSNTLTPWFYCWIEQCIFHPDDIVPCLPSGKRYGMSDSRLPFSVAESTRLPILLASGYAFWHSLHCCQHNWSDPIVNEIDIGGIGIWEWNTKNITIAGGRCLNTFRQLTPMTTKIPSLWQSAVSDKPAQLPLGFVVAIHWMTIALPDNKFSAYSIVISEMLKQGWTSKGELEMNIGQWVLLVQIIPTVHHFLSRLRFLKQRAENRRQITINEQCKEDLQFLLLVLGRCHQGIDLKLIAFWQPTQVYRLDSCPTGLWQPQRFCVVLLSPQQPKVTCIKQPPWAPCSNNYSVDRNNHWTTQKWQLRTFDDQQHNLRRLAVEVEFHRGRQGPHPSHYSTWSSPSSRDTLPLKWNNRIEPVVPWSR